MNSLYIIDAMELAHRCYFGNKEDMAGSCKSFLMQLISTRNPTHILAANDPDGYLRRHGIYPQYKAGRKPKEEEFLKQLPIFMDVFTDFGIKILKINEYEADDVIGSAAKQWGSADTKVYIVSRDKDMMQLVDNNISIYKQLRFPDFEIVTSQDVEGKLGVRPDQVVDYMALTGDKADNVPGVQGIGPVAAERLIKSYGTIESIYQNAGMDKLADKLSKGVRNAEVSKVLVTIVTGLDLGLKLEDCVAPSYSDLLNRNSGK